MRVRQRVRRSDGPEPFFACALAAALACAVAPAPARADGGPASIRVTGVGQAAAAPDTGRILAGVVTEADTAAEAMRDNGERVRQVLAALEAAGVEERQVQTRGLFLNPVFAEPDPAAQRRGSVARRIAGYRASTQLAVEVRGIDRVGGVIDQLVGAGANEIASVSLEIGDPTALADQARRQALADARRRAELFASEAGVRLGPLLHLEEGSGPGPGPTPRMMRMEAAADMPIAPGEVTIGIELRATYEIQR